MAKSSNLYVRIEPELKEQAEAILSALGIPVSIAITMYYKQIVLQRGIPFKAKLPELPLNASRMTKGIRTRRGYTWHPSAIRLILENEKYAGDLKLQKVFVRDHLTKEKVVNHGELPIYWVENDHEPIVSKEQFQAVQLRLKKQSEGYTAVNGAESVFTGKIRCAGCGKNYRRKTTPYRVVWCCATFNSRGKKYCPTSKMIPEETLKTACATALGLTKFDAEVFEEQVICVDACHGNLIRFHFYDGSEKELTWKDRSRRESWTQEMREAARQKALSR